MVLSLVLLLVLPLVVAIIGMILINICISYLETKQRTNDEEIKRIKREEFEKSPEGIAEKNKKEQKIAKWKTDKENEMLTYLADDPDLEKFKARCRARGEVF